MPSNDDHDEASSDASTTLRAQLSELPLERLVSLLSGGGFWTTETIDGVGLPAVTLTDGPHGLRRQPDDADHLGIGDSVPATCFPTGSNLAASWDPRCWSVSVQHSGASAEPVASPYCSARA